MYCKHCGKSVEDKAAICVHCGRSVRSSLSSALESNEITKLRPVKEAKSPGLAGFLGFFLGLIPFVGPVGYLYLGQWNWFWITFIVSAIAYPLTVGLAWVIFPFVFAFHQYQMAKDLNESLDNTNAPGSVTPTEEGGRAPHES